MQAQFVTNQHTNNNVPPSPPPSQEGMDFLENIKTLSEHPGFSMGGVVDKDVITARAFPRNIRQCMDNVEATIAMSPEVAASCYYTLTKRPGTAITGASIRLAEIFASFWGNIQAGTRVISNNGKSVVVEGWCMDLETNAKVSHEVSRGILTKDKKPYSVDMQNTTISAASAIAFRNVVFKIIPRVFIDKALRKSMDIAVEADVLAKDKKAFEEKRHNMFEGLEKRLGVPSMRVLTFFGKDSIDAIDIEDLKIIRGVGTAIKDGMIKAEEAFVLPESRADQINNLIVEG